eukprot:m.56254 g.56254  ORF g.56254 m.56254 type:complete len:55 (+) comp9294_c0_seq4:3721-3885(+)
MGVSACCYWRTSAMKILSRWRAAGFRGPPAIPTASASPHLMKDVFLGEFPQDLG